MERHILDLFLAAFLLLCLSGLRLSKAGQLFNSAGMERDQTVALRGVLCVLILFHHSAILTGAGFSAGVLKRIGPYVVGLFYALSGYGLMASWEKSGPSHYWKKRWRSTLLPYLLLSAAAAALRLALGEALSLREILLSFVNGKPLIRYSWFILTIALYYLVFYLAGLSAKRDRALLTALVGVCVFFAVFALRRLGFEGYWYNAAWCFPLGILWYALYPRIVRAFERHPWIYLLLSGACAAWLTLVSEYFFWFDYLSTLFATAAVSVFLLLLMLKLRLRHPLLRRLGEMSLEVYLVHGLVVTALSSYLSPAEQSPLFLLLFFPAALALSWLCHLGFRRLLH